jgi:hypothetical protein
VVPANHFEIQKQMQQKIKLLQSAGLQMTYVKNQESKFQQDNLIKELEYEINEGVDNFYKQRRMPIAYG